MTRASAATIPITARRRARCWARCRRARCRAARRERGVAIGATVADVSPLLNGPASPRGALRAESRGYDRAHERAVRADDPGPALDPARRPAGRAADRLDARRHPRARPLPLPRRGRDRVPAQPARARPAAAAAAARPRRGARLPPLRRPRSRSWRSRSGASSSIRRARRRPDRRLRHGRRTRAARPAPSRTSTGSSTGSTPIAWSASRSRSRRPTGPTTSAPARSRTYTQDAISFAQGAAFSIVVTLFNLVLIVVIADLHAARHGTARTARSTAASRPATGLPLTLRIEKALAGYVRGQLILSTVIGLSAGIGMWILGRTGLVPGADKYALLFGVWTAVIEVIPYIGPWLSAVPPAIYALVVDPSRRSGCSRSSSSSTRSRATSSCRT